MSKFTVVLPNIRSSWNVGAIFRSCDALGFEIILTGYTARPIGKSLELIKKTSIGAEKTVNWQYFEHSMQVLASYEKSHKIKHLGIEINSKSQNIYEFLKNEFVDLERKNLINPKKNQNLKIGKNTVETIEKIKFAEKNEQIENQENKENFDKYQKPFEKIESENVGKSVEKSEEIEYFLWFGNEISGIESEVLQNLDFVLHLPMNGSKESLNIANCVCACGYLLDFAVKNLV